MTTLKARLAVSPSLLLTSRLAAAEWRSVILDGQLAPQVGCSSSVFLYSRSFAVEGIIGCAGEVWGAAGEALLGDAADGGREGTGGSAEAEHGGQMFRMVDV